MVNWGQLTNNLSVTARVVYVEAFVSCFGRADAVGELTQILYLELQSSRDV